MDCFGMPEMTQESNVSQTDMLPDTMLIPKF